MIGGRAAATLSSARNVRPQDPLHRAQDEARWRTLQRGVALDLAIAVDGVTVVKGKLGATMVLQGEGAAVTPVSRVRS